MRMPRVFLLALVALGLSACSVVVSGETCTSNADCAADQACVDEGFCLALVGPDQPCQEILGSEDRNALRLGFIMTFSGPYAEGGNDQKKVVKLALDEINNNGRIQGQHEARPLAFIACDDQANKDRAIAATNHLHRVGVPAVLGPGFSSLLKVAAEEAAIPNGTFLLSPSSTAPDIRDLADDDLIWRVSSSDTEQTNTLAYFAVWIALEKASDILVDDKAVRVVVVHTRDIYGDGIRTGFESALQAYKVGFQGALQAAGVSLEMDSVGHESEATAEDWPAEIERIVEALKDPEDGDAPPDILLFAGYDGTADILSRLKSDETLGRLPMLLTDGASSTALATTYTTADELPDLLFGVQPGFREGSSYEHFLELYDEEVLPAWTEYSYDGVYLLAYAAAGISDDEMTGAAFAEAFTRFDDEDGRLVRVGPDHLIPACQDMGEGKSIDVSGASGPLDFDLETGEPKSVGILRWTVDFSSPDDPGEIVDCGLAMKHVGGQDALTTYWCNAQCLAPPEDNAACDEGACTGDPICSAGLCTSGDDCKPEHAP